MSKQEVKKEKSVQNLESLLFATSKKAESFNKFVEKHLKSAYPLFISLSIVVMILSIFKPSLAPAVTGVAIAFTAYMRCMERENKDKDIFANASDKMKVVSLKMNDAAKKALGGKKKKNLIKKEEKASKSAEVSKE